MLGWVISGWSVLIGELLRISGSKNWTFFPFSVQASRCLRWKQFTRVKRENMQHLSSYIDTRWTKIFQWPFIQTLNSKERRWSHAYFFVRIFFLSMKNTKKGELFVDNTNECSDYYYWKLIGLIGFGCCYVYVNHIRIRSKFTSSDYVILKHALQY